MNPPATPSALTNAAAGPRLPWRPLRVAFLLSSLRLSGGVRAVVEYANRLDERGHTATLVAPRDTLDATTAAEIAHGVNVRECEVALKSGGALRNAGLAWSLARAAPPSDVIVATHTPTTVSSLLASRLLRRGRPVWLFMDYAAMFDERPVEAWLLRHALRWHNLALTISESSAAELATYAPGPITVVGLGIGHAELLSPVPFGARARASARTILYVGDSRPRKGLADLIAAAEQVQNTGVNLRLVIASKEDFAPDSRLPVEFHLMPSHTELARLYQTCDLFVSASWSEGLGWPALEAMACATPVVLTDSGGPRDYARDGENCLVVPVRSPAALAAAMARVLADDMLAGKLSANGPATAARYNWAVVIDRLEQCLLRAAA